ncbi:hypothetical protein ACX4MT_02485 [Roseomonas mucosa]
MGNTADGADGFQGHVSGSLGGPFDGLFQQDGAEAGNWACEAIERALDAYQGSA